MWARVFQMVKDWVMELLLVLELNSELAKMSDLVYSLDFPLQWDLVYLLDFPSP